MQGADNAVSFDDFRAKGQGPMKLGSHVAGLIGRAIQHSRSPAIHEAEARELGLPLAYRLVDFDALGLADARLDELVRLLAGMGFSGCNVTYPFKQQAMASCTSLGDAAATLGAVNTLVFGDGEVRGENTDWQGFSWLVELEFGAVVGQRIAQIGAGGAGSATAYALARLGVGQVLLYDPAPGRAAELAARLSPAFATCTFIPCESAEQAISKADGVVNATPVGTEKLPGTPFPPALMQAGQWLADIIYAPWETEVLAAARRQGQKTANGASMVVGQAAEAFRIITGAQPDSARMLARLLAAINSEQVQEDAA
jgi:shikimate dehydrogenase